GVDRASVGASRSRPRCRSAGGRRYPGPPDGHTRRRRDAGSPRPRRVSAGHPIGGLPGI
ncbi:MAG: hypothetical protein AVDCRST_MAG73-246, partial [uncultured Thermomicrobiales bacterium]